MTLTAQSLATAMQNSSGVDYVGLFPAVNQCLLDCDCTTVDRSAMWFGQVGEESGGLRWMEEIASGAEYEGRADLGNTQPGDGVRFKGRGPIQVTGRHNYTALSQWAFSKGLVPSATFFVDNPAQLASNQYGFIGVTWYWTTQRPMNDAADARDIVRATQYVNGGTNGLADRTQRWQHALGMGDAILPSGNAPAPIAPPVFNEDNQIGTYNNYSTRHGDHVDLLAIHTEEPNIGQPQDGAAQRLANVIKASEGGGNPVSYHYSACQNRDGSVHVIDLVDTDYECWAVLDSNPDSINYCFAESSVSWTTDQWMQWYGNAIDVVAYLIVQDAQKYGVPIKVVPPPYNSDPPAITDHRYVTEHLGDGTHVDVGDNFPWPYFTDRINHYAGTSSTGGFLMALTDAQQQEMYDALCTPQPSLSPYAPANPPKFTLAQYITFIDGANHADYVESGAREGNLDDLTLLKAAADRGVPRAVAAWGKLTAATKALLAKSAK